MPSDLRTLNPTIFVVDDDEDVRESCRLILRPLRVPVVSFRSAEDFLETWDGPRPGCLLLDVRMAGMSGIELLKHLCEEHDYLSTIVITGHGTFPMVVEVIKHGAVDFLKKPYRPEQLRGMVESILTSTSERWEQWLIKQEYERLFARLSPREREVYGYLINGMETKQIAYQFGLSASTVEKHRLAILRKMETDTVPQLLKQKVDATGSLKEMPATDNDTIE